MYGLVDSYNGMEARRRGQDDGQGAAHHARAAVQEELGEGLERTGEPGGAQRCDRGAAFFFDSMTLSRFLPRIAEAASTPAMEAP